MIREILAYVDAETIEEFFLQIPELRPYVIAEYYSDELHFALSPPLRPYLTLTGQKLDLVTFVSYGEITWFLDKNPDICPRVVKFITFRDFLSMEELLTRYRHRFLGFPAIEFLVEGNYLPNLDLLFSFSNMSKLHTARLSFSGLEARLSRCLQQAPNLKALVLLGHSVRDWSAVTFPSSLSHLDISWTDETDVLTMQLPDSLTELYWNRLGLSPWKLDHVNFPLLLRTLMITHCYVPTLRVAALPKTLHLLVFSNNAVADFDHGAHWPENLVSLDLATNEIADRGLEAFASTVLPDMLDSLTLSGNPFTDLLLLSNLPACLDFLDLSDTRIRTLRLRSIYDNDFFAFPASLTTLNIQSCPDLSFEADCHPLPPSRRFHLPSRLENLNAASNKITSLDFFVFPVTLRRLYLSSCPISDVCLYDYEDGRDQNESPVAWRHLCNLVYLEFYYCSIASLHSWRPPPNLRSLDLRHNQIPRFDSFHLPFLSPNTSLRSLHSLNLAHNVLSAIDANAVLPPQLGYLNISDNQFSILVISKETANHSNLFHLQACGRNITTLHLVESGPFDTNLHTLDLSNTSLVQTPTEIYSIFANWGLTPKRRKNNVKSIHVFV